jgi:(p)ppGpp synthase/HD superfamily hydrolase
MKIPSYLKDISTERHFRLNARQKPDPHAIQLWDQAINSIQTKEDSSLLSDAFQFAKKIDYNHVGMSSDIYFMHPLRTAAYALLCEECQNIDFGIIGLLHNVFELSTTSSEVLSENFNENITNQILALTVNRDFQWDLAYKKGYYEGINCNPLSCRAVKIFDKLDNLYVLGLNPDEIVRGMYLSEIRTHILPMAQRDLPSVYPYLSELVDDTEHIGFLG